MEILLLFIQNRGVAWSSGQHRRLPIQGLRVRTPTIPLFLVANIFQATARRDMKILSARKTARKTARRSREDKGGSGDELRNDRQANMVNGGEKA